MLKRLLGKQDRAILFLYSDSHCGFRLGLLGDKTQLKDRTINEYYYLVPNVTQNIINRTLDKGIKTAKELAGNDPIVSIFVGDATHGTLHLDEDFDVINSFDQVSVAVQANTPIVEMSHSVRFILGTGAHGSSEEMVADRLQEKFPDKSIDSYWHGRPEVCGLLIEAAHKGPSPGTMEHTKGNAARSFLRDRMNKDLKKGKRPADLYVYGHFHTYLSVWHEEEFLGKLYRSQLIMLPPLCSLGSWGRSAMRSLPYVDVGVVIVEIINGQINQKIVVTETMELRKEEVIC